LNILITEIYIVTQSRKTDMGIIANAIEIITEKPNPKFLIRFIYLPFGTPRVRNEL
jgi:hypothetical protein